MGTISQVGYFDRGNEIDAYLLQAIPLYSPEKETCLGGETLGLSRALSPEQHGDHSWAKDTNMILQWKLHQ